MASFFKKNGISGIEDGKKKLRRNASLPLVRGREKLEKGKAL